MLKRSVWLVVLGGVVLLAIAGSPEAVAREASIVSPPVGDTLVTGGYLEVRLQGLSQQDATRLVVEVWARPVDGRVNWDHIAECEGSFLVRAAEEYSPAEAPCAWLSWIDGETGEASLTIRCNREPEAFVPGEYEVVAEVYRDIDGVLGRWADTDQHRLHLVRERAPGMEVRLPYPPTGSVFTLGETVQVEGRVLEAALPVQVSLEAQVEEGPEGWSVIAGGDFDEAEFALQWDTGVPLAGRADPVEGAHLLRVRAEDAAGEVATSDATRVFLERSPRVLILVQGQSLERAEVSVGEPVSFGVRTEPEDYADRFASFRWDFGDGNTSDALPAEHAYEEWGTFNVTVTAYTEPELRGDEYVSAAVEVTVARPAAVSLSRMIYGYPVPGSEEMSVLPGFSASVQVRVDIGEDIVGFSLVEEAPEGWAIDDRTDVEGEELDLVSLPAGEPSRATWVVTSQGPVISAGTEVTITYVLVVPEEATPGRRAAVEGLAHVRVDEATDRSVSVPGQSEVRVVAKLPVSVAIAYLERAEEESAYLLRAPSPEDDYLIGREQIRIAEELLRRGDEAEVPHTGGEVMTPELYLLLRSFHESRVPVTR